MIETIKLEDSEDPVTSPIYHRIHVMYPSRHEYWEVRIKDCNFYRELCENDDDEDVYHIILIFEKCGPVIQMEKNNDNGEDK